MSVVCHRITSEKRIKANEGKVIAARVQSAQAPL